MRVPRLLTGRCGRRGSLTKTLLARSRLKIKGRRESGPFIILPKELLESSEYSTLSAKAVKLLIDLFSQYNGFNNGDFSAAWKLMAQRGWRSRDTLRRALNELVNKGFITMTRQGGKHRCSLYAVTWKPIDECKGKLDIAPTKVACNSWRKKSVTRIPCQPSTPIVSIRRVHRVN